MITLTEYIAKMSARGKIWNGLQTLLIAKIWPQNEEPHFHLCNVKYYEILISSTLMK